MTKVLIVAEVKENDIKKPTLELLSYAKQQGLTCEVVLIGESIQSLVPKLASNGASTVYVAEDVSLKWYTTLPYTTLVHQALQKSGASQLWMTTSENGKDLTPRIAARLGVGAITDVVKLELQGDQVVAYRPAMATKVIQKCTFTQPGIRVLSIRSGAFDVVSPSTSTSATVVSLDIPAVDSRVQIKQIVQEGGGSVDLADASIVVSIGRGVKDPAGVEFVRPLSDLLGAGFGASRAVCDAGWMPHTAQIGQTGKVVTPSVYFAIGISGAIQHLAGMSGSKTIVAVNKDADAPIFKVADYGIVGDLFKVVPLLLEGIKTIKKSS